eukprot:g3176.t1
MEFDIDNMHSLKRAIEEINSIKNVDEDDTKNKKKKKKKKKKDKDKDKDVVTINIADSFEVYEQYTSSRKFHIDNPGVHVVIKGNEKNISGVGRCRALVVRSSVEICKLNFRNCGRKNLHAGGAILLKGAAKLRIRNCYFENCRAKQGGSLFVDRDARVKSSQTVFASNFATLGGCIYALGHCIVRDSNMILNEAAKDGGCIYAASGSTVEVGAETIIEDSRAYHLGAGIYADRGSLTILGHHTFMNNKCLGKTSDDDSREEEDHIRRLGNDLYRDGEATT